MSSDAPAVRLDGTLPVEDAVHQLIELLETHLTGSSDDEVLALRRVLRGRQRPQDEATLAGRFQGSRLCVVAAPPARLGALSAELASGAGTLVDSWEDGLVTLVPGLPRGASSDPRDRVSRTIGRIHRVAPTAAVGVSTALDAVSQAPRGLDEATRALESCRPGKAVLADDVWFQVAVSRMRDSLADSLAVGGPLARLDDGLRSGADLRRTLATWLEVDGDVREAAAQLHLHPNTLRYRLRRAAEITGLDLDDPLQRLVAHLVLTA